MDFFRKLPALLQQHYEKVLLGAALAALALSGLLLAQKKQQEEEELKQYEESFLGRKPVPWTNVNWSVYADNLKEGTSPLTMDFTKPRLHNLLGPVKWQRRPDGSLLKVELGTEVGPDAVKVTKIAPLYLTITADKAGGGAGYFLSVTREGATNALMRKKMQFYVTPGTKDRMNTFTMKEIKGTPESPEIILELADTGEKISLFKDKPYQRVDGYKADLSYPPESRAFSEKRLGETIPLGGEDYIIIAISPSEVVLSARSNNKRTTRPYDAGR